MNISAEDGNDALIFQAAEGFLAPVCHEVFDLLDGARDAGEQLHAVRRHRDVVLDTNLPAHADIRPTQIKIL